MGSGSHLVHRNGGSQALLTPHHWGRRDFMKGMAALAGTAGLCAYDMRSAAAEPPPEIGRIRLIRTPIICTAPQQVAEELLRDEGFSDVQYIHSLKWNEPLPS